LSILVKAVTSVGEAGLLVGRIVKGHPMREFDGYASTEATKKKIAYNVFKKGDCYFLTGELSQLQFAVILSIFCHYLVRSFHYMHGW